MVSISGTSAGRSEFGNDGAARFVKYAESAVGSLLPVGFTVPLMKRIKRDRSATS